MTKLLTPDEVEHFRSDEYLFGPDILLLAGSIWTENGRDRRFVAWHQDSAYFGLDPDETITAWIAISDSDRENGRLGGYLHG